MIFHAQAASVTSSNIAVAVFSPNTENLFQYQQLHELLMVS